MNAISWLLLAQHSRPGGLGDGLRGRAAGGERIEVILGFLVLGALIVGVWAIMQVAALRKRRTLHSPRRLFQALCRAHGLSWSERRLLRKLACCHGLDHPARLFVEPERFAPAGLDAQLLPSAGRLERICERLFTGLPATQREGRRPAPARGRPGRPAAEPARIPLPPAGPAPTLDIPPWTPASS